MPGDTLADALRRLGEGSLDVMTLLATADSLAEAGKPQAAITLFHAWIGRNADSPLLYAVHFNFAVLLSNLGIAAQAAESYRQALRLNPDFLPPYINLGNIVEQSGDHLGAVMQWQSLLDRLSVVNRESIDYKLMALKQMGRVLAAADLDELAERAMHDSIRLDPGPRDILQHWFNQRQRQCRWPYLAPLEPALHRRVLQEVSPLSLASYSDDPLWQLSGAASHTAKEIGTALTPVASRPPPDSATERRLRIGYLSSDLCEHAVGYLTVEVFALHDKTAVELFVYYNGAPTEDRIQRRIRAAVDHWRDIRGRPDTDVAREIVADGIDILVDLNGHTKDARTALLGLRPAPIQVNWLGYPGSMGSVFHHYIIADDVIIPPEAERHYSERVLRLPCYQPTDRQRLVSEYRPSRAEVGLPEAGMVFCCFNEPRKITEQTWDAWMQIMTQVPDSLLWLLIPAPSTRAHLVQLAAQHGVAAERLVWADRRPNPDHLARYPLADLILDSFPYGAHTTASDALWMGVPVLTRMGHSFAARVCGSLLRAAGMAELVCPDATRYIGLAIALARDPARRATLRQSLVAGRDSCLLFDTPRLVMALEGLYRSMWQDYCRGQLPSPDLTNLSLYQEIGVDLALTARGDADLPDRYRLERERRRAFSFVAPDQRL